ncbi:TonB-dependent receptor [Sphingomonas sp.]|uniref:TonB-dependent receptor n=1 Tax=Sphingomonas sp. TaxID=28214 RepID=UPI0025E126B8|nr:TonB-dependent receptor [Sphingomonas sp.]
MNCTRTFLNASVAIAALVASPAIAQDATVIRLPAVDATSPPVAGADGKLQDIVVTAQRRTQRLQDVPIAISAFSPRDLTTKQIRTTLDIPRLVPNMVGASNVGIGSANTYFIRGLGNTESIATFDPPVGTYVDDIYISRQNANNFSFFDIDRIEVLRGPQGTLFGRNTTGGAINVILKKPSTRLGGYAEASYGNYNGYTGRASIDIPVSSTVLTKFSGFGISTKGFVHNRTTGEANNGDKGYGLRAAVRFLPTESITWDVSGDYIHDNSVNVPSTLINGELVSFTGLSTRTAGLAGLVAGRKAGFHFQNVTKSASFTSNIQIKLGEATLALITGYRDLKQDYLTDVFDGKYSTGGFALANAGHFKQFSQEVKLNGKVGRLTYTAGIFYIRENNSTDFADVFTLDFGTFGVPLVLADRVLRNKTTAPAVYAQLDYQVTDLLSVTVGARYTDEKKSVDVVANANPARILPPYGSADILAVGIPLSNRTKLVTPRVAIQYKPMKDVMLFASATKGFRSGGWNARALSAATFQQFGPEKVWSYEAGFRSEFANHSVRVNATAFYTDVKGFQVPLGFIDGTGAINFVTQNGSDFRNYGLETDVLWVPTTGLSLFANLGLQSAKYRNPNAVISAQQASCRAGTAASCGQGIVDPQGNLAVPQRAPKLTASFGGSYDAHVGALVLSPSANASYQSRLTVGTASVPQDFVSPQWLVGASLALRPDAGRWKASLECANCFNKHFVVADFPPVFKFYSMPRTVRVTAGLTF